MREKEIRSGRKGEKYLDLVHVEIKMPEKYFKDVQFSIGEKKSWELSSKIRVRDDGLRFTLSGDANSNTSRIKTGNANEDYKTQ